jgi:hypothetical protein
MSFDKKKWRCGPNSLKKVAMWRIDPLLDKYLEKNNETTAVAMQHASKIELLLETVFSVHSVQSGYKEDNWGVPVS